MTTSMIQKDVAPLADDTVIRVDNVSKKFCKNLKQSMKYGINDLARSMFCLPPSDSDLRRDEFWAVNDVSFELKRGQCLGLIGHNGCGKTTLLRLAAGIFPPDRGEIAVKGRVGALISLGAGFHPHMTGRENIYLNGAILGLGKTEIDACFDDIVSFAEISEFLDAPLASYSSGMRVRLGFAIAVQIRPDLLLVDEVLAVGDIGFRLKCMNAIRGMMQESAIVLVTHSMEQLAAVANRILVLDRGRTSFNGTDVGKGIDHHHSSYMAADQRVFSSEEVSIDSVWIGDQSGQEQKVVKHGSSCRVSFRVLSEQDLGPVCFVLIIADGSGRPVAQYSSLENGFQWSLKRGESRVTTDLGRIALRGDRYSLRIGISSADTNRLLVKYEGLSPFVVESTCASWAPYVLKADWNVSSA